MVLFLSYLSYLVEVLIFNTFFNKNQLLLQEKHEIEKPFFLFN